MGEEGELKQPPRVEFVWTVEVLEWKRDNKPYWNKKLIEKPMFSLNTCITNLGW